MNCDLFSILLNPVFVMMRFYTILLPTILALPVAINCNAQSAPDTSFIATASANAIRKYSEFIQGQTGLYSGTEYKIPERTNEEHPFFGEFDWQEGEVFYNGEFYDDIALLYDITSDNVIIEHFYNGQEVRLIKAKVERFRLGDHRFIHLNASSLLPGLSDAGFYRVVYDGPTRLLARHTKQIEEKIETNRVEIYFTPRTKFYVLKDGEYHRVTRKNDFYRLFPEKKQALKSFLAGKKIRITRKNPEAIALLAEHSDSINHPSK